MDLWIIVDHINKIYILQWQKTTTARLLQSCRLIWLIHFVFFTEAPFVFIDTTTKNFQLGEEIQCACLVRGLPEPTVTWKKFGKRFTSNDRIKITKDHILIIKNAKPSDAGLYECIAANVVGQSKAVVNLNYTGLYQKIISVPLDSVRIALIDHYFHSE